MSSQKIGVATATIVGMNAMIGSGIFAIPASLALVAGPAGILTILFVSFAVWFLASSMARLAYLYPQEGSFYTYAKQWGGHRMGVLSSGAYLIGLLVAMGLLAQMAGIHLQHYFPGLDPQILAVLTLIALTSLNVVGLTLSEIGQYILIFFTVFPLVITILMCLTKIDFSLLTPFAPFGMLSAFKASRAVIFAFFGFECAASLFSIVKDPEKNVPKALTYSLTLVSVLYFLFATGIILSTPLDGFTDPSMPFSQILLKIFPNQGWVIELVHISTLSAILGTIHSMIWSSSSLLITFVSALKNKTAKKFIGNKILNPKTSVVAIGSMILASCISLKGLDWFFFITAACIVFANITSMITLLTLPNEWKNGQNLKTVIGIGTAIVIWAFSIEGLVKVFSQLF